MKLPIYVLLTCLFLSTQAFANEKTRSTGDTASQGGQTAQLDSLKREVTALRSEMERLEVAKNFFTSIISSQTAIFSTIVVVFAGITWVFTYFRIRGQIRVAMAKEIANLDRWKKAFQVSTNTYIEEKFQAAQGEMKNMHAGLSRAFANMHKDSPSVSFIWWLRSALEYTPENSGLIEMSLTSAYESAKKVGYRHEIGTYLDEINKIMASLDQKNFDLQIKMLRGELERIYKTE